LSQENITYLKKKRVSGHIYVQSIRRIYLTVWILFWKRAHIYERDTSKIYHVLPYKHWHIRTRKKQVDGEPKQTKSGLAVDLLEKPGISEPL
jgi:hypothetical protein